jgi:ABC-type polysaccharide/polyol phosphate transport system ATPase subunit
MDALQVVGLGKRYLLDERADTYATLRHAIVSAMRRNLEREASKRREIWALRGVTVSVREGEIIGIIGRNGAGKSTLLKILARITRPTEGIARSRGSVGALLEVGTGFHPELTGRENVFLNGAVLGMTRREVRRKFDEIASFAGVERFLDTPVKRYSSGMYLRLAFSVAAHFEPDIVIVDEVLAVGDADFQQRCLGKMSSFAAEGRTVVFVSHDLGAIGRLCSRVCWIEQGGIVMDGAAEGVIDSYFRSLVKPGSRLPARQAGDARGGIGDAWLEDERGETALAARRGEPFTLKLAVTISNEAPPNLDLAVYLLDSRGTRIFDESWLEAQRGPLPPAAGDCVVSVSVPPLLRAGEYVVCAWLGTEHENLFDGEVLSLRVLPRWDDRALSSEDKRVVQPPLAWRLAPRSGGTP